MSLRVRKGGMETTVQDCGRFGYQQYGVGVSGAMDPYALRIANLLLGNDGEGAGLEMAMSGAELLAEDELWVAACGADMQPTADGVPMPMRRPVRVRRGTVLRFGPARSGCRAYLAVAGGVAVPRVLGSRSTFRRAALGGLDGRALREGDVLPVGAPCAEWLRKLAASGVRECGTIAYPRWSAGEAGIPEAGTRSVVRCLPGPEWERFGASARAAFLATAFRVSPQSDRMGLRLTGAPLIAADASEMRSGAVATGTIQVPPDGNPIILGADRQTTGGYPRIAQAAAVDLATIAQCRPGDTISFRLIGLEEAQALLLLAELELDTLRWSVGRKIGWQN